MTLSQPYVLNDRQLLVETLSHLRNTDAVVIAISNDSAEAGYHLAKMLGVSFDVMLCKAIDHPADNRKTIGSISVNNVIIHGESYNIPRDYIYHQILVNQNALKAQQAQCRDALPRVSISGKHVVLVGDRIDSIDSLMAVLNSIQSQRPDKIFVAATVMTFEVFRQLSACVDDVISQNIENGCHAKKNIDNISGSRLKK